MPNQYNSELNSFDFEDFKTTNEYKTNLKLLHDYTKKLKTFIDEHAADLPDYMTAITDDLNKCSKYSFELSNDFLAVSLAGVTEYQQHYGNIRKALYTFLMRDEKSVPDNEYFAFTSMKDSLKYLDADNTAMEAATRAALIADKYAASYGSGKEEENISRIFNTVGPEGHKPSIHECLTMSLENTGMETYFDRFVWLANENKAFVAGTTEPVDNTVYGYAFRRMIDEIKSSSPDKQMEFALLETNYKMAANDAAQVKYDQLKAESPTEEFHEQKAKFRLYNTPEYRAAHAASHLNTQIAFGDVGECLRHAESLMAENKGWSDRDSCEIGDLTAIGMAQTFNDLDSDVRKTPARIEAYRKLEDNEANRAKISHLEKKLENALKLQPDALAAMELETTMATAAYNKCTGFGDKIMTRTAEVYHAILTDKRSASDSFTAMRDSLKNLFSQDPETTANPDKYMKDMKAALASTQSYLDSHKSHRFTEQGKQRVEWANAMKTHLSELAKTASAEFRTQKLASAKETLASRLANLPAGPASKETVEQLKDSYAEIMFQSIKKDQVMDPQREAQELNAFKNSMALKAAFSKHDSRSLQEFAANFTDDFMNREVGRLQSFASLDKAPKETAERYIATKVIGYPSASKTRFFDNFTNGSPAEISEISANQKRCGLSTQRGAMNMLAFCECLKKGLTVDEILDPFGNHNIRHEAGETVLNKYSSLNDADLAKYVVDQGSDALKTCINYMNDKFAELSQPDGFTLRNYSDPRFQNLRDVSTIMQDIAQEMERPAMKPFMEQKEGLRELLAEQVNQQSVISAINSSASKLVDGASQYSAQSGKLFNSSADNVSDMCFAIVNGYGTEKLIREQQKSAPNAKLSELGGSLQVALIDLNVSAYNPTFDRSQSKALSQPGAFGMLNQIVLNSATNGIFDVTAKDGTLEVNGMNNLINLASKAAEMEQKAMKQQAKPTSHTAQKEEPVISNPGRGLK